MLLLKFSKVVDSVRLLVGCGARLIHRIDRLHCGALPVLYVVVLRVAVLVVTHNAHPRLKLEFLAA